MSDHLRSRPLLLGMLLLTVLGAALLLLTPSAGAADFDLHLTGSNRLLSPEAPTAENSEQYELDPVAEQDVANFSIYLGSLLRLSGPVDFTMYLDTSDVHRVTFKLNYRVWTFKDGYQPLGSTITGTKEGTSYPGPDYYFNGNYTVTADANQNLGTHDLPAGSSLWVNISVQIDWRQADPNGNSGTFYWGSELRDSLLDHEGRMLFFDDERQIVKNQRRDFDPDTLFMAINLTDAFGVGQQPMDHNDLNYSSAAILIEEMAGDETIRQLKVEATEYSNLTLSAVWNYQEDGVPADTYTIIFRIRDVREQTWEVFTTFYVEVDVHAVKVKLIEGEPNQKVGRGKTVNYLVQVTNVGNTVDTVWFEKDDSDLSVGWSCEISNFGPHVLYPTNSSVATVTVRTADDAPSNSYGVVIVRAYTNSFVDDRLSIKTQVQRYGVDLSLIDGKAYRDFDFLTTNAETGITFDLKVKNSGNGQDTFSLSGTADRSGWEVLFYKGEDQRTSVSLDGGRHEVLTVKIIPLTSDLKNEDETEILLIAISDADSSTNDEQSVILRAWVSLDDVANLLIMPDTLELDPKDPVAGEKVTLSLTIFNEGGKTASNFQVQLVKASNNQIIYDEIIAQLGPSESLTIDFEWKNPAEGTTGIIFRLDSLLRITESNEDDNEYLYNLAVQAPPTVNTPDDNSGFLPGPPMVPVLLTLALVGLAWHRRS